MIGQQVELQIQILLLIIDYFSDSILMSFNLNLNFFSKVELIAQFEGQKLKIILLIFFLMQLLFD